MMRLQRQPRTSSFMEQFIEWTILMEGEQIVEDVMKLPPQMNVPFGLHIPWTQYPRDMNYTDIFFNHFFPSMQGKAAVLDEFLASPYCSCHTMVANDKIQLHCPEQLDPDFIVSNDCHSHCKISSHKLLQKIMSFVSIQVKICVT